MRPTKRTNPARSTPKPSRGSPGSHTKPTASRTAKRVPRRKRVEVTDRVVHIALSPYAAQVLRAALGRMRHDDPVLTQVQRELEDQL